MIKIHKSYFNFTAKILTNDNIITNHDCRMYLEDPIFKDVKTLINLYRKDLLGIFLIPNDIGYFYKINSYYNDNHIINIYENNKYDNYPLYYLDCNQIFANLEECNISRSEFIENVLTNKFLVVFNSFFLNQSGNILYDKKFFDERIYYSASYSSNNQTGLKLQDSLDKYPDFVYDGIWTYSKNVKKIKEKMKKYLEENL